ncbi:acetyl-CoA hydrolase/transferase family protein, partial [Chloroflexota bacterium]
VKSGNRVLTPLVTKDWTLSKALFARRHELENVQIVRAGHGPNPGWLDPGYEDSFQVTLSLFVGDTARPALDARRVDYQPGIFSLEFKALDERAATERKDIDVLFVLTSPPDEHGFCSFGDDLWHKKEYAKRSKIVVAEVDERQIRTYGDNFIHVSDIDYFVEYTPPLLTDKEVEKILGIIEPEERRTKLREIIMSIEIERRSNWVPVLLDVKTEHLGFLPQVIGTGEPDQEVKQIAEYVSTLVKDGDCLQFGTGAPSAQLVRCGILDNKHDLGIHSEIACKGVVERIWSGIITGKRKNLHTGKAIFTALSGASLKETQWCNNNPLIELHGVDYVTNIRTVAANDNYVAINSAISVDFTGQINAETVFSGRMWNGALGQVDQHLGAMLSKGGRGITCLRSIGLGGAVSRIVPQFDQGTVVSIPRYFADYVVTEYGIARLLGKTQRERANELIAVAHPNFRAELRTEANNMFG